MSPLIVENLKKSYGKLEALKGVSFDIKPGEIFGLLGPNGAGKTTLISTITTLETDYEGDVKVFGQSVAQDPLFTKSKLGVVHQEIINTGFFNVDEILDFHSGYYGVKHNHSHREYLLEKLSLKEHRKKNVKQLSGGMKRRLMIAKALVHQPQLLLLDEPTAGVDVELRETLWKFVLELKAQGVAVLLTTHYLEEAEKLCDRVAVIHRGELKALGETKKITQAYSNKKVTLMCKKTIAFNKQELADVKITTLEEKISEDLHKSEFVIPAEMSLGDLLTKVHLQSSDIVDIKIEEGRLEDAFLRIVAGKSI